MSNFDNEPLPQCSQDWQGIRIVHNRKREMIKAGIPADRITGRTSWVQYGSRSYPRTRYEAMVEYFRWPIDRQAVDASIDKWKAIIPQATVTTYYHCAD